MSRYTNPTTTVSYHGIGVSGLLGVVFVALKLCGVIDWSWWLVTAPFWVPFAIAVLCFIVALVIAVLTPDE